MLYSKFAIATADILVVIPAFAVEPSEAIFLGDDSQVDGATDYETAPDKFTTHATIFNPGEDTAPHVVKDNYLPKYALLKCYALKTLILPRTCTEVETRAMQECEDLEILVVGDDIQTFNWNVLNDCASLIRLYLLATHKPDISSEFAVWRWLCNNYNPTFDAFYVRPSLYQQYVDDPAYTGSSWQRTNNVTTGLFHDDATFCTFAAHGVATANEMPSIRRVNGWFWRQGIKDLTALRYTSVDSLLAADFTHKVTK